jgi:hypothetical protein
VVLHRIGEVQFVVGLARLESGQRGGIGGLVAKTVLDLEVLSLDLFFELFIEFVGALLRNEVEVSTLLLHVVHGKSVAFLRQEVAIGIESDFVVLYQLVFIPLLVQAVVVVQVGGDVLGVGLALL